MLLFDEHLDAAKCVLHARRPLEVVREIANSLAEAVLRGMRREAADLGAADEAIADGAANESGRAGDEEFHTRTVRS
jgi:hypothetical protein